MESTPLTPPTSLSGRTLLDARLVERCDACRAERARGTHGVCRCTAPRWRNFCTRCVKAVDGDACPNCLAVAEANGRKLRAVVDEALVRHGGLAGAGNAFAAARTRAEGTLREFGIGSVLAPLPDWAVRLADKRAPLPPGAEHSRVKMKAITELRLEAASVEVALQALGYGGRPLDDKLVAAITQGTEAAADLASWDGLSGGGEHEQRVRSAATTLANAIGQIATLVDSLRRRDLSRLVEATVRRQRALRSCETALGVA
jgi:hypothetical protein